MIRESFEKQPVRTVAEACERTLSTQRSGTGIGDAVRNHVVVPATVCANLNLIERLWKFIKRRAFCGRYQPTFAQFQAAIQEVLDGLSTTHAEKLKSLMTLKFQRFEDVSLMAA